jgi:hypothetical protein
MRGERERFSSLPLGILVEEQLISVFYCGKLAKSRRMPSSFISADPRKHLRTNPHPTVPVGSCSELVEFWR